MSKAEFLKQHQRPGETYAGILLGKNGDPDQHIYLVATRNEHLDFEANLEWANNVAPDSRAPNRRELHLLKANLPEMFDNAWYWSGEEHAERSGCAWFQYFYDGFQYWGNHDELYGVAVRRVHVEEGLK